MTETDIPLFTMPSATFSGAALEWLTALPAPPTKADLCALGDDFAIKCILELTANHAFDLSIHVNHPASEWLNHFYFEARNREKVFGTKNLGIGYPFVLTRLGRHDIAAPLFLWQVVLEPSAHQVDHWQVQRNAQMLLQPNYSFFHLLDQEHGTDFSAQAAKITENVRRCSLGAGLG
jgi:hypothetical protein